VSAGGDPVAEGIATWAALREAAGEGASEGAGAAGSSPRSVRDGAVVELREVTQETVRAVCRLQVAEAQRGFVAPNAVSFAEALFEPKAWYRAITADGVLVGFAMLYLDPEAPQYYLWRLMVGEGFQGLGYGREAVRRIVDHVRGLPGASRLLVSWVPGPGSPEPFYLGLGFVPTGELDDEEVVAALAL
jgi:diamine N-acetyltransferase